MREASIEAVLARMPKEFQGLGSRELNGNKTPAVGPIENKDLKAAWHIFREFQDLDYLRCFCKHVFLIHFSIVFFDIS